MSSPAIDIKDVLVSHGVGVFGQTLFVSREPTKPNDVVTVYDTGGFDPEPNDYLRPTVQVKVRNHDYSAGYAKAEQVRDILHEATFTQGGFRYMGIWVMSDIAHIGYDSNDLALFTINFRIHRTPTT